MLSCPWWGAQIMSSRSFNRLGLLYAAIPMLAGAYNAYEMATAELERQHTVNWLTIFVPRLSLALILAFVVYRLFRAAGSFLVRLHGVALAAQPTWQFITSNSSARLAASAASPVSDSVAASTSRPLPSGHVHEHIAKG
jgi:hypothetical protein